MKIRNLLVYPSQQPRCLSNERNLRISRSFSFVGGVVAQSRVCVRGVLVHSCVKLKRHAGARRIYGLDLAGQPRTHGAPRFHARASRGCQPSPESKCCRRTRQTLGSKVQKSVEDSAQCAECSRPIGVDFMGNPVVSRIDFKCRFVG